MPQPLSKVCPKATVSLHFEHSTNNPDLAILVTGIFARWAWIEHSISSLLVHILGAEAKPALAMFSLLNGQRLQMSAVKTAAKAALPSDQFKILDAVVSAIECVQKDRNRLAHWIWGTCPELPGRLLLADPETLKAQDIRIAEHITKVKKSKSRLMEHAGEVEKNFADSPARKMAKVLISMKEDLALDFALMVEEETADIFRLDHSGILVYSKQDLERSKRDLGEMVGMLTMLRVYLEPPFPDGKAPEGVPFATRAQALGKLSKLRLFREAQDRAKGRGLKIVYDGL